MLLYKKKYLYFTVPVFVFLGLMIIFPIVYTIFVSLERSRATDPERYFVGFDNYRKLLVNPRLWQAFKNSLVYAFLGAFAKFWLGFGFALLLNRSFKGRSLARSLLFLPWVIPVVAWCTTWRWMYSTHLGIINRLLLLLGLVREPLNFLGARSLALPSVLLVGITEGYPFFMVTLLAALQAVPDTLYEAASIDGASGWQQFINITIPSISGVIKISLVLGIIWSWNSFPVVWLLTKGGPSDATHLLVTLSYEYAFIRGRYDYGASLSVITVLFLILLFLLLRRLQRGGDVGEEG